MSISRTKTWATIVYPESALNNWQEILKDYKIPALISPLHNADVDEDGILKKAHYHVLLLAESLKSKTQIESIFNAINGVGIEQVHAPKAYARYLCHLDDPEKAQYNIADVISIAGANYPVLIESPDDKYILNSEMMDFCIENHIVGFAELSTYAKNNRYDWYKLLVDHGQYMNQFLRSYNWELTQKNPKTSDAT